jgi:hypothetical protein
LTVERGPRDPLTWRQPVITIEHCAAANYHTGAPVPLNVCAIGAVGVKRGVDMSWHDPEQAEDDPALVNDKLAADFDIAHQLAAEVQYVNDECGTGRRVPLPRVVGPGRSTAWEYTYLPETPEERWARVRAWAVSQLHPDVREAFRLKNA